MNEMRYVLVTGASSGIGKTCALFLDDRGFRVFAGVRSAEAGDRLCKEASERLQPLMLDITNTDMIETAVRTVTGTVGDNGLLGLVNNAGISLGGPLEYIPLENVQQVMDVNVMGTVAITQALLPLLREAHGRIVNIGSLAGKIAMPLNGPYGMSKFALEAFSDVLRRELEPAGIQVALIEPGAINTPMWRKARERIITKRSEWPDGFEERYGKFLDHVLRGTKDEHGIAPDSVAKVVHHALTAHRPKTRYVVGVDAKVMRFLGHWLPDRWLDGLFRHAWKG